MSARDKSGLPYTVDELKLKMERRKRPDGCPFAGKETPKSTKITKSDIMLMARLSSWDLSEVGDVGLRRLCGILDLVNGGYVTKSQYGVYHFHEDQVVSPVKEMRFDIATGRITSSTATAKPVRKMPSWDKLFG